MDDADYYKMLLHDMINKTMLYMESARDKALEDAAKVADEWYFRSGRGTPGEEIRAMKKETGSD